MVDSMRLLFNKIPYEIRREDLSHIDAKEIENFLLDAFPESLVGINDISRVYVDNKYNPQTIIVETFKNIKSQENIVTVNWGDLQDQDGAPVPIWINYIETDILPEINIIKKTCIDLGYSQNELAYILGVKDQSLRNMISKNKFTTQIIRSINLLIENHKLKHEIEEYSAFKQSLQKFIQPISE